MDPSRFDTFTKILRRRPVLRLLAGLPLSGILSAFSSESATAGSRIGGTPCTADRQCLTGKCAGSGRNRRCTCTKQIPFCKQPRIQCREAVCNETRQRCVTKNTSGGTCASDGKPCTRDVCDNGTCTHPNETNGALCDGGRCSGGVCGEEPKCTDTSDDCTDNADCCSQSCAGAGSPKSCLCSSPGMPCIKANACCLPFQNPCIGFYCGGCRGKGQPCGEKGVSCCDPLVCLSSVCQELTIGG
jgi:hypothetical protein